MPVSCLPRPYLLSLRAGNPPQSHVCPWVPQQPGVPRSGKTTVVIDARKGAFWRGEGCGDSAPCWSGFLRNLVVTCKQLKCLVSLRPGQGWAPGERDPETTEGPAFQQLLMVVSLDFELYQWFPNCVPELEPMVSPARLLANANSQAHPRPTKSETRDGANRLPISSRSQTHTDAKNGWLRFFSNTAPLVGFFP